MDFSQILCISTYFTHRIGVRLIRKNRKRSRVTHFCDNRTNSIYCWKENIIHTYTPIALIKKEYNPSIMTLHTEICWGVLYKVGNREITGDQNLETTLVRM